MRRLWIWSIRCLVASVLALLTAEGALRVIGYEEPIFLAPDATLGVRPIPGAEGVYHVEGRAFVRINSAGFRDMERSIAKPPNTLRVAVLGDSFVEALEVPLEQTFPALLQNELQICPAASGRQIEVLNFGVQSFGTAQELITLERYAAAYSPDVVVVAFYPGDGVGRNSLVLSGDPQKPYYVLKDGDLVLDDSYVDYVHRHENAFAEFWYHVAVQHSRLAQLLHEVRRNVLGQYLYVPAVGEQEAPGVAFADKHTSWEVLADAYRAPRDPAWVDAWAVTEALLARMQLTAQAHGAQFTLVTITSGVEVIPDPIERERVRQDLGLEDLGYTGKRLHALAERDGFPDLQLLPVFQQYAESHHVYLHGFGSDIGHFHWNPEGHRVAAGAVSTFLCDEVLPHVAHQ